MKSIATWLSGAVVMVALGLAFAGAPLAQTASKSEVRNFEVISVDGNFLVFRDQNGTNALNVPDDFRFTVDGKKVPVSALKAGIKGTAVVTTTTTLIPVYVTDYREAVVLQAGPASIIVRDKEGVRKRYSQDQLDKRGIQIVKDGRVMRIGELKEGDVISATIVSQLAPVIVTEQEVLAALDKGAPAPAKAAAEAPAMQPAPGAAPPAAAPAATPAAAPAAAPAAPPPSPSAAPPAEASGMGALWYVIIGVIVLIALFLFMRKGKSA